MNPLAVLRILEARKVFLDGHFELASGRHTNRYLEGRVLCDDVYTVDILCYELHKKFEAKNIRWIVGPPMGGIPLATLAARGQEGLGLIVLRSTPDGNYHLDAFDRERIAGDKVALIDDFTSTGGSLLKAAKVIREARAEAVQFGVIVNRDPLRVTSETFGAPLASLLDMDICSWEEKDCPLCAEGIIPVHPTVGHGPEFYARQNA